MGPFLHVDGKWHIVQDNGFGVDVTINQKADGTFSAAAESDRHVRGTSSNGTVDGLGNFHMTINWDGGTNGQYNGKVQAQVFGGNALVGTTFDLAIPDQTVGWSSEGKNFAIS